MADRFKEYLTAYYEKTCKKASEVNALLTKIHEIWQQESTKRDIVDNDWQDTLRRIGHCVVLECEENSNIVKTGKRTAKGSRVIFDVWRSALSMEMQRPQSELNLQSFIGVAVTLYVRNEEVWTDIQGRSAWFDTIEFVRTLIAHYTVEALEPKDYNLIYEQSIEHLRGAIDTRVKREQTALARILFLLLENARTSPLAEKAEELLTSLAQLFVHTFQWEIKNAARTVLLDIVQRLFVEFAYARHEQLLRLFEPLARRVYANLTLGSPASLINDMFDDGPCYERSLLAFIEVFAAVAYPRSSLRASAPVVEEVKTVCNACAKQTKYIYERALSRDKAKYRQSISQTGIGDLRFVARMLVLEHNLLTRSEDTLDATAASDDTEASTKKRVRVQSWLDALLTDLQPDYFLLFALVFTLFRRSLDASTIERVCNAFINIDIVEIRRAGRIDAYADTLSTLLTADVAVLSDETVLGLWKRSLTWLHIPNATDKTAKLLLNCLTWIANRIQDTDEVYKLTLNTLCRVQTFTAHVVQLLVLICRQHDFDESYALRSDLAAPKPWTFRHQLISVVLRDSPPDAELSSLLFTLLFMNPACVTLEGVSACSDDDVLRMEEDLDWLITTEARVLPQRASPPLTVTIAPIDTLFDFVAADIHELFYSDTSEATKLAQLWRTLTVLLIKLKQEAEGSKRLPLEKMREVQKSLDKALADVVGQSSEAELLALDIGAYWRYCGETTKTAISNACTRLPQLRIFSARWNVETAPLAILSALIKMPRRQSRDSLSPAVTKVYAHQKMRGAIGLLRAFGRHLSTEEYYKLCDRLVADVEVAIEQRKTGATIKLHEMLIIEMVLGVGIANRERLASGHYLLTHCPLALALTNMHCTLARHAELDEWLREHASDIAQMPHELAYFASAMLSSVAPHMALKQLMLTLQPFSQYARLYIDEYDEIAQFVAFVGDWRRGKLCSDDANTWSSMLRTHTWPRALYALRERCDSPLRRQASSAWVAPLAQALAAVTAVLCAMAAALKARGNGSAQETAERTALQCDLIAIGRQLVTSLLRRALNDNSTLSELLSAWLHSVGAAAAAMSDSDLVGFRALDGIAEHKAAYPQLWSRLAKLELPFAMAYSALELEAATTNYPLAFDAAYEELHSGVFDYTSDTFETLKARHFWKWLRSTTLPPKKCLRLLHLVWVLTPSARCALSHIMCLYPTRTLRATHAKMFDAFLAHTDEANVRFLTACALYNRDERVLPTRVIAACYATLQSASTSALGISAINERADAACDSTLPPHLAVFVRACFALPAAILGHLAALRALALHDQITAVFAVVAIWRRCNGDAAAATAITHAFEALLTTLGDTLDAYEILLLTGVAKALSYVAEFEFKAPAQWIRALVRANLTTEALYFVRYVVDFNECPQRALFHLYASDRASYVHHLERKLADELTVVYTRIVTATRDVVATNGLPLTKKVEDPVRATIAESRFDWGVAAALHTQSGDSERAARANHYLGHSVNDLSNADNYRYMLEVSTWPLKQSADVAYAKLTLNHNAALYSRFVLAKRDANMDLANYWSSKFVNAETLDSLRVLEECRDLKVVELLADAASSERPLKLPNDADGGVSAAFALALWRPATSNGTAESDSGAHASTQRQPSGGGYFVHVQELILKRVRELLRLHSFQRAQSLLTVLESVALAQNSVFYYEACFERAQLHRVNAEHSAATYTLERMLAKHADSDVAMAHSQSAQMNRVRTSAYTLLAEFSDANDVKERCLGKAQSIAEPVKATQPECIYMSSIKYAAFAFRRYSELDQHTKSRHFQLQSDAIAQWQAHKESPQKMTARDAREFEIEKADRARILRDRQRYLCLAAANYMRALAVRIDDESLVLHLTALIVQNADNLQLMEEINSRLEAVQSRVWISVANVLSSYLFVDKPIAKLLHEIFVRTLIEHPHHCASAVLFHASIQSAKEKDKQTQTRYHNLIVDLLKECRRRQPKIAEVLKAIKQAYDMLAELGDTKLEETRYFSETEVPSVYTMKPKMFRLQTEFKILSVVPIPTCTQPIGEPGKYDVSSMILFAEISDEFVKAGGLSAPTVMTTRGSDGHSYKIIFKRENLRLDALIQLLFHLSNILITQRPVDGFQLRALRTYIVVPIHRHLGLIEWCADTLSLNDYLVGPNKTGGAHRRFRPDDMEPADAFRLFNGSRQQTQQSLHTSLGATFKSICEKLQPVLRFYFYENFASPTRFLKRTQHYADSLALWSMARQIGERLLVGYVVGLGDRHLNNILMSETTAELCHIDLGMVFEYSKRALPIPERVPFRLTRDLADVLLVESIQSRFRHVCVHALACLRDNAELLVGVASLLLQDPVSAFTTATTAGGTGRNVLAETAILRLRSKLDGRDLSVAPQSVEQQVTQLINEARNPENLALMFAGWQPYI